MLVNLKEKKEARIKKATLYIIVSHSKTLKMDTTYNLVKKMIDVG